MRDTVVIFARVPRLGTVKRRLARDVGEWAALQFYTETLACLLRACARDRRFRTVLALTPKRATFSLPPGVTRIDQGPGNLGERMHSSVERFKRGRVVLIGSDIPDATTDDIVSAFRALGSAHAVFGPATDGGYWLVGLGPRRPWRPFGAVRWSSPHALTDTLANFRGRPIIQLRILTDVDDASDLSSLRGLSH